MIRGGSGFLVFVLFCPSIVWCARAVGNLCVDSIPVLLSDVLLESSAKRILGHRFEITGTELEHVSKFECRFLTPSSFLYLSTLLNCIRCVWTLIAIHYVVLLYFCFNSS